MGKERYLITGATGLIGSALVKRLVACNVSLTCPVRNLDKARQIFDADIYDSVRWVETSVESYLHNLSEEYDYIIHCASPTASKLFVEKPVETIRFGIETTTDLLNYASNNSIKGMVYLSSLESYGTILDDAESVCEEVQGYVNPLESRSSYNIAKRTCESLCHAYAYEYKVPVKIVRLTQTVSPLISMDDMRVFAQFARLAASGKDIELHTEGTACRQYIHISDAVDAILCVLYKGAPGEAYNAAREDSYISVRDMANFIQDNFNPAGKVVFHLRDDMGYAPTTKIRMNTGKLQDLGWTAKYSLYDMFKDVIESIHRLT